MHQLQSLSQLRLTSSTRGEKDDLFSPRHFCQDALTTREGCARDASYAKRAPREPGRPRHTPVATLHDRRPLTAGACRRRSPAPAPPHRQPAPAPPWPSDDVVPLHPVALAPGRSGCDNGTTSDMTDGRSKAQQEAVAPQGAEGPGPRAFSSWQRAFGRRRGPWHAPDRYVARDRHAARFSRKQGQLAQQPRKLHGHVARRQVRHVPRKPQGHGLPRVARRQQFARSARHQGRPRARGALPRGSRP